MTTACALTQTCSHDLLTMQRGATTSLEKLLYKKGGTEAASRKEES